MLIVLGRRLHGLVILVAPALLAAHRIVVWSCLLVSVEQLVPMLIDSRPESVSQPIKLADHVPSAHALLLLHHLRDV